MKHSFEAILPCAPNMPPPPAGLRVGGLTAAAAFIGGDGGATVAPWKRRRSNLGRRLLFDAAQDDKPLSRCDDPSPCYLLVNPDIPKDPPDEIEVAWDALSNTYVCLFDGAYRLALEATSPAERAVPCSRHTKWSKV